MVYSDQGAEFFCTVHALKEPFRHPGRSVNSIEPLYRHGFADGVKPRSEQKCAPIRSARISMGRVRVSSYMPDVPDLATKTCCGASTLPEIPFTFSFIF